MQKFKISDPSNNTGKNSESLIPQKKEMKKFRISDPPNNTGKNSEFLFPQKHRKKFRISDHLKTQAKIQNF